MLPPGPAKTLGWWTEVSGVTVMDERPAYSIGVVSQRTGVPADTIRAWERRYHVAVPQRTPGRHRLYSERDIQVLRWLRERVNEGMPISNAVALLANGGLEHTPPAAASPNPTAALADALRAALLEFRPDRAEAILSESFALHSVERTCLDVIQPTLYAIGDGWHAGTVSVAQEHFASHVIGAKLAQLASIHTVRASGPAILTACAPGELHELGIAMLALFLAWRGYRVINLGADVPREAALDAVEALRPRLLCLSASSVASARRAKDVAEAVQRTAEPPIVALGGAAIEAHPELRAGLPGVYLGPDAGRAAEAAVSLLAAASPPVTHSMAS